jgi:hypothetical protein
MWMGLILGLTAAAVLMAMRFQRSSRRLLGLSVSQFPGSDLRGM